MVIYNNIGRDSKTGKGDRVLFHKNIFSTYDDAINALKSRYLAPGEIAVARYYVGYNINTVPPTWSSIRMVMGIGGATPHSTKDVYIFNDSVSSSDTDFITGAQLNSILSNYYDKNEIDEIIKSISIPGAENFATKDDINQIELKIDNIDNNINNIQINVNNKVDINEIDDIVIEAISNSDTVETAVQNAINDADIDQKVIDAVDNLDIITKENLIVEVTTQIENNETINELQTSVKELLDTSVYDGSELSEWNLEE